MTVVSFRISLYKLLADLVQQCPSFHQLFATHYGFKILSTLSYGLQCSVEEFKIVQNALEDVAFSVTTVDSEPDRYTHKISKIMKEYIWILARIYQKGTLQLDVV